MCPAGKHSLQTGYLAFFPQSDVKENPSRPSGNYQLQVQTISGVITPYQVLTYNFPLQRRGKKENAFGLYVRTRGALDNRLTLSPGVRFDRYRGYNDPQRSAGWSSSPPADRSRPLSVYTWNRVVPRIGAAYDLSGDGKTVIRASYGQYSLDQLGTFDLNFNPAALFTNTYTWKAANSACVKTRSRPASASDAFLAGLKGVGSPNYLSTTGGITGVINPDLKMPYFQTATLGFEREVGVERGGSGALRLQPGRADVRSDLPEPGIEHLHRAVQHQVPRRPTRSTAVQPLTILTYPASLRSDLGNKTMFVNRTDKPDIFNNLRIHAHQAQVAQLERARRALSMTKNHKWLSTTGVFAASQSAASPTAPYQTAFPLDETWDYSVKAHFTYDLPREISLGVNYRYLAGTAAYATDQITGVPQLGTVTMPLEDFGTRRNPGLSVLDLRAAKTFSVAGSRRFAATMELFNPHQHGGRDLGQLSVRRGRHVAGVRLRQHGDPADDRTRRHSSSSSSGDLVTQSPSELCGLSTLIRRSDR